AISLTSVQLVQQLAHKGDPVAYVIPKSGGVFLAGATGIAAAAPHPSAARLFVDFYLSVEAQKVLAGFGYDPIRSDVPLEQANLSLAKVPLIIVDPKILLGGEKDKVKANFKKIFGG